MSPRLRIVNHSKKAIIDMVGRLIENVIILTVFAVNKIISIIKNPILIWDY